MNKQQIMALILTAVIGISSCVTAPGISAFASEEETISASESAQGQNTDESSTDTSKLVEGIPDVTGSAAQATEEDDSNPSTEGKSVSTVSDGAEEASDAGITDLNTSGEDSGEEETDSDPEMAVEGQTAATSEEATEAAAVEEPTGETTDETELAVDAKKLTASDPGGSFETAVDIHVNGTCTFTLEDHGEYYLKFTPTESGIHTIYATSSYKYAIADCYLLGSADAQDELALLGFCVKIAVKGRAQVADMHVARRARRKTRADSLLSQWNSSSFLCIRCVHCGISLKSILQNSL